MRFSVFEDRDIAALPGGQSRRSRGGREATSVGLIGDETAKKCRFRTETNLVPPRPAPGRE